MTSEVQLREFIRYDPMWYDMMSCGVLWCGVVWYVAMYGELMWRIGSKRV